MKTKIEHFSANNPNPVLSVGKDGTILYSNTAGEPLLREWGIEVREKLPSYIEEIVKKVISRKSPEKIEVKVGKRIYLIVFHHLPEEQCVNIYGFDISDQKELEGKLREAYENLQVQNEKLQSQSKELQKANVLLSESEGRERARLEELSLVLDAVPAAVWISHDPQALHMTGNHLAYEWLRLPEGSNVSKASPVGVRPETYKMFKDGVEIPLANMPVRMSALGKEVLDYEFDLVYPDGTMRHLLGNAKPLHDEQGNLRGAVSAFIDITERKRAEEEVQGARNMLQLIIDNIPQGIFWKDRNSRYMGCNKVVAKATGVESPENIVGKTDYDLPWSPEQIEWFREYDLRIMENNTPEYHIVEPQREADGELAWVETNKIPLHDAKGDVIGILGTYEDITERKRAEEALRLSSLYNRSLIEASLDPLVTIGRDGKITDVNKATEQVTGYSRNYLIGTDFSDYFTEPEKAREGYQQVFTEGEVRDYPLEIQHKEGYITPVLYNASIYRGENGEVIGVFAAARDITESKEAEEAIKNAYDNLEQLVEERTSELEKAYNSLKESEKGLAEAQKMAHIGNWNWNIVTNGLYWSDEIYRIFGCSPQEFGATYDAFLSYVHPDDREYVNNAVIEALNGKSYSIDHRIILAYEEERVVHEQGEVIFNDENIPIRMIGTVQDITGLKKAEERIQNLANIVESSNDAIGTIALEGALISWNIGAEDVYGYSVEDILGKHVSTLAPPHLDKETIKLIEKIKQGKKVQRYETLRLRKDGMTINVSITLSPVFDALGKLTAVSFISRDITKRKKAEEKLRESEEKYRHIVETANEGILITNNESVATYVNKRFADMLRYTPEELIGRPTWDLISEEYKPVVELNLEKRRQGISNSYGLKLIRKDGYPIWTIINAKPLFENDGRYIGAMSMFTDITKWKEAEEALANIQIARQKEIHHRIKNNLQVISSLLDLQSEMFRNRECVEEAEVLKAFKESQDRVMSIALIHEELHEGRGTDKLNFSTYLERLVKNLFQTYRLGNTNTSLNIELEDNIFFDMDIAVPLGIIINELVSNSLKYAFPGKDKGEIQIKLCKEKPREYTDTKSESEKEDFDYINFVLTVSDNGVGIPESFNSESSDSLGLQLVAILVDQLDGELELRRSNGTEFAIRFTIAEKNNQASTPAPQLVK